MGAKLRMNGGSKVRTYLNPPPEPACLTLRPINNLDMMENLFISSVLTGFFFGTHGQNSKSSTFDACPEDSLFMHMQFTSCCLTVTSYSLPSLIEVKNTRIKAEFSL